MQLQKDTSKWRYICLEEIDIINQEAWHNLSETFAEALRELLDQHRSKVVWNDTGDLEGSRGSYKALVLSRWRISALFATRFRRTISCGTWRETTATRNWTKGVGCDFPLCVLWKQKPHERDVLCGTRAVRPMCWYLCGFRRRAPAFRSTKNVSRGDGDGKQRP